MIRGAGFDLLGLTIARTPPVRGPMHLELDQGLLALYGINGVGKTTLLRLAAQALRGVTAERRFNSQTVPDSSVSGFMDVHLRLHEPLEPSRFWPFSGAGVELLWGALSSRARALEDDLRGRAARALDSVEVPANTRS